MGEKFWSVQKLAGGPGKSIQSIEQAKTSLAHVRELACYAGQKSSARSKFEKLTLRLWGKFSLSLSTKRHFQIVDTTVDTDKSETCVRANMQKTHLFSKKFSNAFSMEKCVSTNASGRTLLQIVHATVSMGKFFRKKITC